MERVIRYFPGGGLRKIYDPSDKKMHGIKGRRGSNIHIVDSPGSSCDGEYFVDFSVLGNGHQFCLAATFKVRDEAVRAELDWLEKNWVLQGLPA